MDEPKSSFQRVAVIAHPKLAGAAAEAEKITQALDELGLKPVCGFLYDENIHRRVKSGDFDLLIALGGDGTMLRAGHLCGPSHVRSWE